MDYIFLIASSVVILACLYFIVSPFFTNKAEGLQETDSYDDFLTLEAVYGAVNELEMDFLMKKINENDYMKLKEQYQLLAAGLMSQEEKKKKKKKKNVPRNTNEAEKAELEILTELQKLRKRKGR